MDNLMLANKSYFTLTVHQLTGLSHGETPGLEATAAGGEVILRVVEHDADGVCLRPSPGPGPAPLGSPALEAVVQISQFTVSQTVWGGNKRG